MSATGHLRIVNFNIKHGAAAKGPRRYIGSPRLVAEACAELNADILALQEVDRFVWRSLFADLFTKAKGATYTDGMFGKAMGGSLIAAINPGGQYGNALLVKGEILERKIIPLEGDYIRLPFGKRRNVVPEPRIGMLAVARVKELEVSLGLTHIGGPLREQFIGTMATELAEFPRPRLLIGDFNTRYSNMLKWIGPSLALAPKLPASQVPENYHQSDHLAFDGLDVHSVEAVWFPHLSDHPAVVTDVSKASG